MLKNIVIYCCIVFVHLSSKSQEMKTIHIKFHPIINGEAIKQNENYVIDSLNNVAKISALRFYVSAIHLIAYKGVAYEEINSFHLVDCFDEQKSTIQLQVPSDISFYQLYFNLGIDSTTNVSGAMGGDLDPTNGMYWTWQSGYINFKLEGVSSLCNTRKNEFHFHLGGYEFPYNSLQMLQLYVPFKEEINIDVNLSSLFKTLDLAKSNSIMSPSKEAMVLIQKVAAIFSVRKE